MIVFLAIRGDSPLLLIGHPIFKRIHPTAEACGLSALLLVRLAGKRFHVFEDALIDTGAAFTVLPPEVADFLELETDRNFPRARLVTASGLIETPVRVLDRIETADVTIERLQIVAHRIPDPAPIKILLGMNFIEKVKLIVSGKESTFYLQDPE